MLKNISKKKISFIFDRNIVYFLIIINITLQVASFIFVKFAAVNARSYIGIFLNIYYLSAISFLIIRAVVWQLILKNRDISLVYPLNSVVPVLILFSGVVFFHEAVSINNIIGTFILMSGILLIVNDQ
jgi:drug/metabolite transporter (DMT)-like permease